MWVCGRAVVDVHVWAWPCSWESIESARRGGREDSKYNDAAARWATSSQVGVVSIAVNAIYLRYGPITTSPGCAPAEGSLQPPSTATNAQLIGEPFYFCKQTLTHASVSCFAFILLPLYLPIFPSVLLCLLLFISPACLGALRGLAAGRVVGRLLQKSIVSF